MNSCARLLNEAWCQCFLNLFSNLDFNQLNVSVRCLDNFSSILSDLIFVLPLRSL